MEYTTDAMDTWIPRHRTYDLLLTPYALRLTTQYLLLTPQALDDFTPFGSLGGDSTSAIEVASLAARQVMSHESRVTSHESRVMSHESLVIIRSGLACRAAGA